MLGIVGNFFILCTLLSNALVIAANICKRQFKLLEFAAVLCALMSMGALVVGFVSCDFALQNVFINSSSINPLMYKIAASWSSHEGSMLLFITFLSIASCYGYFLFPEVKANILQKFIIILMLLNLWLTANPFALNQFAAHEGLGLNPLLQDMALLYHPPILYMGYACCFVYFCYCVFLTNNYAFLLRFCRLALVFLTSGIALGSWWAYRELGWGGYWFFDPVENISLLPWLCAVGFNHSLLSSIKSQKLEKWSMFWGVMSFPLILLGMFLVRSNFLLSVHSFALDASKALILGVLALAGFAAGFYSLNSYNTGSLQLSFFSKTYGLVIGNVMWLLSVLSIVVSLALPIILKWQYDLDLSLEVDYFKLTLLPLFIFIGMVISVYAYAKRHWIIYLMYFFAGGLLLYFLVHRVKSLIICCAIVSGVFVLATAVFEFVYRRHSSRMAMLLGHFAYGFLTLNIALNAAFEQDVDLAGAKFTSVDMGQFEITLQDIKYGYGPNYFRQIVEVKVENKTTGLIIKLTPENRWYAIENKMTAESSIYSFVNYDLYAVLNRIDGDKAHVKIYYRPYMSFIWIAAMLLAVAFGLRMAIAK